jgi:phosphate starvation-inducible PhoH-like protein
MRGRTFKDAFIIADESQNLTEDMMLMLITRLGKGSKMVIEGDLDQNDLPKNSKSGLHKALKLVGLVEDVGVFQFTSRDIVRHPLLQPIIEAWPTL